MEAIFKELKGNYYKQKKTIIHFAKTDSAADPKASYEVALTSTKHGKAFLYREIVKECAIKMALAFGDKKLAKNFENVSVPHQTSARRVAELSDMTLQFKEVIWRCKYFSLALDENSTISDISQLFIFIRTAYGSLRRITKNCLRRITKNIYTSWGYKRYWHISSLVTTVDAYGGFERCADGARAITRQRNGLDQWYCKGSWYGLPNISLYHSLRSTMCKTFAGKWRYD